MAEHEEQAVPAAVNGVGDPRQEQDEQQPEVQAANRANPNWKPSDHEVILDHLERFDDAYNAPGNHRGSGS